MRRLLKAIKLNLNNYGSREKIFVSLLNKSVRAEAEFLDHLEVAIALHACRCEHVVRDGCVCAALESLYAVIA